MIAVGIFTRKEYSFAPNAGSAHRSWTVNGTLVDHGPDAGIFMEVGRLIRAA